ncbi:TPA: helix-turn-helix domain-containing protein [Vibrio parahaemolyticus]
MTKNNMSVTIFRRAQRIARAREFSGKTLSEMKAQLNVAHQTYVSIESGARDVRCDMLSKIAIATGVNEVWLFNGYGKMVK